MIDNPLPDQVMEEYDNNYLSEQFYEHRTDEAHQIAKQFNLKSDVGYCLVND